MEINTLKKLLPAFTADQLKEIEENSLNTSFSIIELEPHAFFVPKEGFVYKVIEGIVIASGYLEGDMEFNVQFSEDEYLGMASIYEVEIVDYLIRAYPKGTLLEIPVNEALEKINPQFVLNVYKILTKRTIKNTIKLFKLYGAKVNFNNEQYFLYFLMSNNMKFTYSSTEDLASLLHIELRTLQRIIKKLSEGGIIKKDGKTLSIINKEKVEDILKV